MLTHVCLDCGLDLARVRPRREPRYGLPLVMCPGCRSASIRRPHPLSRIWANLLRLDAALTALALQVVAAIVLTAAVVGGSIVVAELALEWDWPGPARLDRLGLVAIAVVAPVAAGAWLTAGLGHHRAPVVWAWWCGLCAVAITLIRGSLMVVREIELRRSGTTDDWRAVLEGWEFFRPLLSSLGALALLVSIALLGIPLGWALRWGGGRFRVHRWRWRRRMRRAAVA